MRLVWAACAAKRRPTVRSSAIGTLVERTSRFAMLLHLPRMADRGLP